MGLNELIDNFSNCSVDNRLPLNCKYVHTDEFNYKTSPKPIFSLFRLNMASLNKQKLSLHVFDNLKNIIFLSQS